MNKVSRFIDKSSKILEKLRKTINKDEEGIKNVMDENKKVEENLQYSINKQTDTKENLDVDEYSKKQERYIKIDKDSWHINSPNINIEEDKLISEGIEGSKYISYMEKNCRFTIIPEHEILELDRDYKYFIRFNAEGENINLVSVYVIAYSYDSKLYMERIKANEEKVITITKEVKSIRIAIKIEGELSLDLSKSDICIYKQKKLTHMEFTQYRKLGFDNPKKLKDLKVACIFDIFTMQCLEPEVNLIKFTPENWKVVFEFNKPHVLIVESAWRGNNESWRNKVQKNIDDLLEVISWCNQNEIPTVFWNKEDPVHYDTFINTAKHFDYIFTTNIESVENYKRDLNKENVFNLSFAAQPKLHNPTELLNGRKNGVCFAGSYYRHKYSQRAIDTSTLLDVCKSYDLCIYDRNYNLELENYKFPEEYEQYVKGVLVGRDIVKANKGYKVAINVNTVKDSSTMFARRIFELLASNTPIISNYNLGINNMFDGLVVSNDVRESLQVEIDRLMNDEMYYLEKRIKGLREVYSKHTYEHRMLYLCEKIGINIEKQSSKLVVVAQINNNEEINQLDKMLDKQKFTEFDRYYMTDDESLINKYSSCIKDIKDIDLSVYDYIANLNPYNYYGKYYLKDMIIATKYSDADIIGKSCVYVRGSNKIELVNNKEYQKVNEVNKEAMMVRLKSVGELDNTDILEIFSESSSVDSKLNMYAIDRFNFIYNMQKVMIQYKKIINEVEK